MSTRRIVVVGAGGQARDIAWLIREASDYEFAGFVVTDLSTLGPRDSVGEVLGDYAWLDRNLDEVDALALGIGTPRARLRVAEDLCRRFPRLDWPTLIHPTAVFDRASVKIGRGVSVCAAAAGSVNLELADFSLVNIGVTLGHEARIGRGTVVNHAASISGGVELQDGVLVGTGARILQYLSIGQYATVGAGAVVTRDVLPEAVVVGVPARALRGVEGAAS